ncbi:hypothetical protein STEG23_018808, partial [Scotinomys teguina]
LLLDDKITHGAPRKIILFSDWRSPKIYDLKANADQGVNSFYTRTIYIEVRTFSTSEYKWIERLLKEQTNVGAEASSFEYLSGVSNSVVLNQVTPGSV